MAVSMRKLQPEEVFRIFPKRGQVDVSEYVSLLRTVQPGDVAAITLNGLSTRSLKRRLGQAAARIGYRLKWANSSSDSELYVQVLLLRPKRSREHDHRFRLGRSQTG